jgi:hypothetical protein
LFAAFGAGALIAGLVVRGHRRGGAGGFDYDDDFRGLGSEATDIDLRAGAPVGAATRGANIDYNLPTELGVRTTRRSSLLTPGNAGSTIDAAYLYCIPR